jgi:uncharacterized NAD(P)/FAD-binding protein YdhS
LRRRVVIIGAGFSGSIAAANLLRLGRGGPRVTLIERRKRFGPGRAYGEASGAHLLNVPAARMSAFVDEPDHFVRWLETRDGGDQSARFAPRRLYGEYIESTLHAAEGKRWPSTLRKVRDAAVSCRRDGQSWAVTLASGRAVAADAVVLALGNAPPSAPAPFEDSDLIGAWDHAAQKRLPRHGDVLLLGTGLTMVDVALALSALRGRGVIYALSRRGRTPHAHGPSAPSGPPPADLPPTLSAALHALRAHARADWRFTMDSLRDATPDLWTRLGSEGQRRFLRHLRPWWDSHRHRAAPDVAERVAALIAEGRLRILAGEVSSATREGGVWRVQQRQRGGRARHRMEVVGIINCTGADHALSRWDDPLVRQLLDEGLARAPANGLGFDVDPHNRLRDAAGVVQADLFVLGPLAVGAFWETTAVPELRVRAAAVARALG